MNSPMIPGQSAKGKNAARVVAVDAIIGKATSPTPSITELTGDFPSSMCRYIFSTITIPLSTSIPSARTRENRTITFKVTPIVCNIKNDINIESGIATPTNSAFLRPKKKSKTPTTRIIPSKIELTKLDTISLVLLDWSLVIEIVVPLGIVPSVCAISIISMILSDASNKFFPPCFLTSNITTGEPNSLA